jgi:hypothetical protein
VTALGFGHWAFDGYAEWLQRLAAHPRAPHVLPAELRDILGTHVSFVEQTAKLKAGLDAVDVDGS